MKITLGPSRRPYVVRLSMSLILAALTAGMVGCGQPTPSYTLAIASTAGGNVTTPGVGTFEYGAGVVVNLVATPATNYAFVDWSGDVGTIANLTAAATNIIMNGNYDITADFAQVNSAWVAVGPRSIAGSIKQGVPGNAGAGKVNTLSISSNHAVIYAGSGAGPGNSGPYSDGGAFLTMDGGVHWQQIDNGLTDHHVSAILMDPNDSRVALAGTWFSGVFRTTNSGLSWNVVSPYPTCSFVAVKGEVFAGTSNGVLVSNDFGQTWTSVVTTSSPVRVLASFGDSGTIYAGLDNGQIMSTTDSGASWVSGYQFTSATIWSIAVNTATPTTVYVVAWTGSYTVQDLWASTDGGISFSRVSSAPVDVQYVATDPSNAQVLYAMGDFSSSKSTDGGASFTGLQLNVDVRQVVVDPLNSDIIFVASDQGVYKSSDGGSSWLPVNGNMSSSLLTSGSVSNDGKTYISAVQDYSPIVSFNEGNSWEVSSSAYGEDGKALINPSFNSYAYLFTTAGFFYSNNNGQTFMKVNGLPSGLPGQGSPGPLSNYGAIAVDMSNPNDVYVATASGIYESTDYGASFALNSLQNQVIWAVAADGNVTYAATYDSIFYSTDGGLDWSNSSTPLSNVVSIAIDASNSSIVFVGNDNGLYKSSDGGQSFSVVNGLDLGNVITPPCRGVAAVYFTNINGRPCILVGTGAGLFESVDLGATWCNLTFNMHATEVTSIEYASGDLYITTYGEGFLEWPSFASQ
jgi:hypothetical protein